MKKEMKMLAKRQQPHVRWFCRAALLNSIFFFCASIDEKCFTLANKQQFPNQASQKPQMKLERGIQLAGSQEGWSHLLNTGGASHHNEADDFEELMLKSQVISSGATRTHYLVSAPTITAYNFRPPERQPQPQPPTSTSTSTSTPRPHRIGRIPPPSTSKSAADQADWHHHYYYHYTPSAVHNQLVRLEAQLVGGHKSGEYLVKCIRLLEPWISVLDVTSVLEAAWENVRHHNMLRFSDSSDKPIGATKSGRVKRQRKQDCSSDMKKGASTANPLGETRNNNKWAQVKELGRRFVTVLQLAHMLKDAQAARRRVTKRFGRGMRRNLSRLILILNESAPTTGPPKRSNMRAG